MSLRIGHKLPKKTDSETFEKIVRDCAKKILPSEFYLYGRKGQDQHGIDIYNPNVDTVIQCKNYTTNNIKALKDAIEKDYQSTVDYFLNENGLPLKTFIVATSVDRDTGFQDFVIEKNKDNTIKIEVWFWEDIEEIILENTDLLLKYYKPFVIDISELKIVYTDNRDYADRFCETLFLHDENTESQVNLENLFVMPKYNNYKNSGHSSPKTDLENKLSSFVKSNKRFLFIEGDAGCGKSTLVSWMNYHLQSEDNTAKKIFGDRPVITIRLRNLDKEMIGTSKNLRKAILEYMNLGFTRDFEKRFPNAVMILDGFDELCMIEGISDYNRLLYNLNNEGKASQYIITSRPKYIDVGINIQSDRITLQHFDKEQREEWLEYYTSPERCNQPLGDDVKEYIRNISEESDSAIFDTPMTLYMLAANNDDIDIKKKNSWELYHQIFYHELSETRYNDMFGNSGHTIMECSDIIYRISEEIAYRMYQTNNNQLFVVSKEIKNIIDDLRNKHEKLEDDNVRMWVKQCYALCNYWKETGDGAVEFYHNIIRDFFLCEKIYRELNAIYADYQLSQNDKIGKLIEFFKQFTKASLQKMVCKFIFLRAEKDVAKPNSFVYKEKEQRLLPYLFEKMLTEHKHYKSLDEEKHIEAIVNILSCTAQVYRHIYEYILEEDEYVKWWNSVTNINTKSDIITYCFRYIFEHHLMSEYVSISNRIDIHSLNLSKKYLRDMDFQGADLSRADLRSTDLQDAILSGAYLINVRLRGADLISANLGRADLSRADLSCADLRYAYLKDADLRGADLRDADLRSADLRGADLSGAYLIGATLPDGFEGDSQEEQVQHLKEMNIKGLKI